MSLVSGLSFIRILQPKENDEENKLCIYLFIYCMVIFFFLSVLTFSKQWLSMWVVRPYSEMTSKIKYLLKKY